MTLRYAVANGNWSAPATWDGGTLPGVGDDVYANGKTVTIDQDVTVLSVRTTAGAPAIAGGGFTLNHGRSLNGNIYAGTTTCVSIANGATANTINGTINGSATTNGACGVYVNNTAGHSLTVMGAINGGTVVGGTSAYGINAHGMLSSVNVTGNLTAFAAAALYCDQSASNVTITGNLLASSTASALNHVGGFGSVVSVTGDLNAGVTSGVTYAANISGSNSGNATFSGGVFGMAPVSWNASSSGVCNITPTNAASGMFGVNFGGAAGSVMNITANLYAQSGTSGVNMNSAGTLNIVGNVYGATAGGTAYGIYHNSGGVVNLTGNVTGGTVSSSNGAYINLAGGINVTGNVTARTGANAPAIQTNTGPVNVYGTATATNETGGSYSPGVNNGGPAVVFVQVAKSNDYPNGGIPSAAYGVVTGIAVPVTIDAAECGSGGLWPVSGRAFVRDAGTNFVKMRQTNLGSVTVIGEVANDYPAPADVRTGITYDFGAKVGACAVPPAGSVALGVPVDATTGTAALSPADVWAYGTRSLTEAPDVPTAPEIAAQVRVELATELARVDQAVSAPKTLTGAYDAAKTAASSSELAAAVSFILSNVPEGLTAAEVWAYVTRSLTVDVGLSPTLTARLEQCATVQTTGDQLAAMGV